jgi:hypothetical protein
MTRLTTTIALALLLAGCGGTYVDDNHNFERAFQVKCPKDVRVIHSLYADTPHFTEEHEYYFQMMPTAGSDILKWLTGGPGIVKPTNGLTQIPFNLGLRPERPKWFAPEASNNYEIWYCTNRHFVVLRDKQRSEIFVYGSVGM